MSGATNTTFQNVKLTDSSNITLEENGGTTNRSFIVQNENLPTISNDNKQIGIMALGTTMNGQYDVAIGGNQPNMSSNYNYKTSIGGYNSTLDGDRVSSIGGNFQTVRGEQASIISGYNNSTADRFSTSISTVYGDDTSGEFNVTISNFQQNTTNGDYIVTIANQGGRINTTGRSCAMIVDKDCNITGSTEYSVMLGCSGRTATSSFTTYVENLEAFDGIVMTDYANLDFASDAAAATGGVPLGGLYHNSGAMRIRIT